MADEPPQFDNWKDAWEWHAAQESKNLAQLDEDTLLERVRAGHYDLYYSIWYTIAEQSTPARAVPVLLQVLRREAGENMMLVRYHCAAALFRLLGYPNEPMPALRERVQWDHHGEDARQQALDELERLVQGRLAG